MCNKCVQHFGIRRHIPSTTPGILPRVPHRNPDQTDGSDSNTDVDVLPLLTALFPQLSSLHNFAWLAWCCVCARRRRRLSHSLCDIFFATSRFKHFGRQVTGFGVDLRVLLRGCILELYEWWRVVFWVRIAAMGTAGVR